MKLTGEILLLIYNISCYIVCFMKLGLHSQSQLENVHWISIPVHIGDPIGVHFYKSYIVYTYLLTFTRYKCMSRDVVYII